MTKPLPGTDFRAMRHILEPHDFALGTEADDPLPTDRIDSDTWAGIMNLPDDVAVRVSDHNGTRLRLLYSLWGDWVSSVSDDPDHPDELFNCMLDAADCFQCANFDLLHGFYRAAISNLRTALELVMIGTLGNLRPADQRFMRWKQGDDVIGFTHCRDQLSAIRKGQSVEWLFAKNNFLAATYRELCRFTHARPDASDGALWASDGPVYNSAAILKTFMSSLDVYSISYLLVKIARPKFSLPEDSRILFELEWLPNHKESLRASQHLFGRVEA
jgi:hypothetical protein